MHWTADELYKYVKTLELGSSSVTPGPSPSGDKHFVYIKDSASDTWNIVHNLGKYPAISVVDEFGNEVEGEYSYVSVNEVQLKFSAAFSGIAFLN